MRPHAVEPIFCVGIIRLTPVHNAVQKTAVGAGNFLRKIMRFIKMIVPQKRRALNQRGFAFDRCHHGINRHRAVSPFWAEAGKVAGVENRFQFFPHKNYWAAITS